MNREGDHGIDAPRPASPSGRRTRRRARPGFLFPGPEALDARLAGLEAPRRDALYYALTMLGVDGKVERYVQTVWTGWTDTRPRRELRRPRKVSSGFVKLWEALEQPYVAVHDIEGYLLFSCGGGNALVEARLYETLFPLSLEPVVSASFDCSRPSVPAEAALRRTPSPRLRMEVLVRDGRRCRICGKCPDDSPGLTLEVHHLRPWHRGGLTVKENLMTLCNICHRGLYPHEDGSLSSYVARETETPTFESERRRHAEGVAECRRIFYAGLERSRARK